jgi:hypothetical protein
MRMPLVLILAAAAMLAQESVTVGGVVTTSELVQGWSNVTVPDSEHRLKGFKRGLTISLQFLKADHEDEHQSHYAGTMQLGKKLTLWEERLELTPAVGIATDGQRPGFASSLLTELKLSKNWMLESHMTFLQLNKYNVLVSEPAIEVFRAVTGRVSAYGGVDVDHLFGTTLIGINPGATVRIGPFQFGGGPLMESHIGGPKIHEPTELSHASSGFKKGVKAFMSFHLGSHGQKTHHLPSSH